MDMQVETVRFGVLEVDEEQIIRFLHGLPGFPQEKEFILVPYQENTPFAFLQSIHTVDLAFFVVDPFVFFQDYTFEVETEMQTELGIHEENLPYIINIVTVPENMEEMTTNLLAPILINQQTNEARQLVLDKVEYQTKHRLFPQGFPKAAAKGGK